MIRQLITLCALALTFSQAVWAQENPKIKKKTFFITEMGKDDAKKNLLKGEHFYRKGQGLYDEALKYYLKAHKYNNRDAALNYKIAICYLYSNDKELALDYILHSDPSVARDYYYIEGVAHQYNNQFDEAVKAYNTYLGTCSKIARINAEGRIAQKARECELGKQMVQDTVPVFITNLGPIINTYYDDYNAIFNNADSLLYFTSRRPEEEPRKRVSRFKFTENIWTGSYDAEADVPCDKVWMPKGMKSRKNISVTCIRNDQIYFYKGKRGNGTIYIATRKEAGKGWGKFRQAKGRFNHVAYKESVVSIDDANNIYYVTNHRGGEGGNDIWMAQYKMKNRWEKPVNLGPVINTPFDEECVSISPDGQTMYFSSNGHPGMGGFDVYKSTKDAGGNWSKPENLGFPINSPANELFYQPTSDPNIAFYSTMRKGGYGGLDIYSIVNDLRQPFFYKCLAIEADDMQPLDISVSITNEYGSTIKSGEAIGNTKPFSCRFEDAGLYIVNVNHEGYKPVTDTIKCVAKNELSEKLFVLEKLRHPFTISGTVTDVDKQTPLAATILFKDPSGNLLGKTNSSAITGNYVFSFEDKVDFTIEATVTDYHTATAEVKATQTSEANIKQDLQMKISRIDYFVRGRITEEDGTTPVRAALVFYERGSKEAETIAFSDSLSGNFNVQLKTGNTYLVEIEANLHFFVNDAVSFPAGETMVLRNYQLKKMDVGAKLVIENILFNTGKSTLKPQSFAELDKFANLLLKNPTVQIEVSGHTDNVGSASINKKLSRDRALTVKNYLINKGVEAERITHMGYGFDQPIAPNDTPEGREQNRRVEIKVLK